MIGPARHALERLQRAAGDGRLEALCATFDLDLVAVHGSAIDPTVTEPGDLDVAVRFSRVSSADVIGLTMALVDLVDFEGVDVLDVRRADVVARSRALGRSVPLYEREPGMFANAQMAAIAEDMDTAHLRRLDLELLARR